MSMYALKKTFNSISCVKWFWLTCCRDLFHLSSSAMICTILGNASSAALALQKARRVLRAMMSMAVQAYSRMAYLTYNNSRPQSNARQMTGLIILAILTCWLNWIVCGLNWTGRYFFRFLVYDDYFPMLLNLLVYLLMFYDYLLQLLEKETLVGVLWIFTSASR